MESTQGETKLTDLYEKKTKTENVKSQEQKSKLSDEKLHFLKI